MVEFAEPSRASGLAFAAPGPTDAPALLSSPSWLRLNPWLLDGSKYGGWGVLVLGSEELPASATTSLDLRRAR